MAERGKMYTILQDKYLVLELFNGKNYSEVSSNTPSQEFVLNEFKRSKLVFNLSSFDMSRTNVDLFRSNKMMRNFKELITDVDSLTKEHDKTKDSYKKSLDYYFTYYVRADSSKKVKTINLDYNSYLDKAKFSAAEKITILSSATNQARNVKSFLQGQDDHLRQLVKDRKQYETEAYKRFTSPFACFILFLIGAPLGAIIRKGGLGIPVLVGIIFFILFYLLLSNGEKAAKESQVLVSVGMLAGEAVLLCIGLFFLNQAWNDASIFDLDFYSTLFKQIFGKKSVTDSTERVINSLDDLTAEDLK
jgi:lipopolysaccharide export system permease protein